MRRNYSHSPFTRKFCHHSYHIENMMYGLLTAVTFNISIIRINMLYGATFCVCCLMMCWYIYICIKCVTIFMLYLQIYCPYKHEWRMKSCCWWWWRWKILCRCGRNFFFLFRLSVVVFHGLMMMQGRVHAECAHSQEKNTIEYIHYMIRLHTWMQAA